MAGNIVELTDQNFEEEVIRSSLPVIVDFWAEWCAPCKKLEPLLEKLGEKYNGKVKIGKLNVEENPKTAMTYGIRSIPALIIFFNGEAKETLLGLQPLAKIEEALRRFL